MTKTFKLTPELTCPELEGHKLPEMPPHNFTLADIRKAFLNGIAITGEGANGEYCNGNNPDIEYEFGQNADIYIESITRIPIAIEVKMVRYYNHALEIWQLIPATHQDGTVKGVWVYE
jgi:hypothetical protein